jgi:hypothetical protein
MGGTKQKERVLRQVNVDTQEVSALSESLNTISSGLMQTEDVVTGMTITSPVMKKVNELPVNIPAAAPTEQEVIDAHDEVGLKLSANSKKHPKRVQRAAEKRTLQRNFVAKRTQVTDQLEQLRQQESDSLSHMDEHDREEHQKAKREKIFKHLKKLDLKKLMYDKSGDTGYEKLAKHYKVIKTILLEIPDFEQELANKKGVENPSPEQLKEIEEAEARLKTLYDLRAHFDVYEKLTLNKYYAMLPHEEMEKLSYKELRMRLDKLYKEPVRKQELIDYYQNLIRLKEIGLEDGKSVEAREKEYLSDIRESKVKADDRDPKEEMDKMAAAYKRMTAYLEKESLFMPEATRTMYMAKLFDTFQLDIDKFRGNIGTAKGDIADMLAKYDEYRTKPKVTADPMHALVKGGLDEKMPNKEDTLEKSDEPADGIVLGEVQKEGVRLIGAWVMRHSLSSTRKYTPFAFNLLQAPPEQQLLVYYLIENEKQDSAMGIDFFTALHNYQPDLSNFKKKFKLDNISRALRASMGIYGQMKAYGALTEAIRESDSRIEQDKDPNAPDPRPMEEKRATLVQAISQRGVLLKMLYRNAGLHEDMPPDMAEDPMLRKKLFDEYGKMGQLIKDLDQVNKAINDGNTGNVDYVSDKLREGSDDLAEDGSTSALDVASRVNEITNDYVVGYGLGLLKNTAGSIGGYAAKMTETAGFAHYSGWTGGLTSLLGLAGAIVTATSIGVEKTISVADRTAQALSVSGDFIGVAGDMLSSAGVLTNVFTNGVEASTESLKWLGNASDALWNSTQLGDKLALAGGAVGVIAGTAKFAAEAVHFGRAVSSRHDLKRSSKTLDEKDQDHLTEDEKILQRFLKHENREVTRKEISAGVGMVTGAINIAAGALAMTGFLAPIAGVLGLVSLAVDIGFGKIMNAALRHSNRKKAVDDMLNTDALVEKVKNEHPNKDEIKAKMKDKDLKEKVRTEALAMLGFSSYHECYRHVCTQYATMLYDKVFVNPPAAQKDKDMYLDAMKSLGMKMVLPGPGVQADSYKPTVEAMIAKMMD